MITTIKWKSLWWIVVSLLSLIRSARCRHAGDRRLDTGKAHENNANAWKLMMWLTSKPKMLKTLLLITTVVLAFASVFSQTAKGNEIAPEVPKSATVEIILLDAPGINDDGSRWEINYEFRIASEAAIWDAHKRKDGSEERVGDLLKEGSFKQTLRSAENRRLILAVPLAADIQARLRNQPIPGEAAKTILTTAESRELEGRSQSFRFRLVAEVYDAKLKKSVLISQGFDWPFAGYPAARFEIKVKINGDGGYRVETSRPKGGGGKEIIREE